MDIKDILEKLDEASGVRADTKGKVDKSEKKQYHVKMTKDGVTKGERMVADEGESAEDIKARAKRDNQGWKIESVRLLDESVDESCGSPHGKKKMSEDEVEERKLTKSEKSDREDYVKGMKKNKKDFKKRYGDDAESVMYATATKMAKEGLNESEEKNVSDKQENVQAEERKEDLTWLEDIKRLAGLENTYANSVDAMKEYKVDESVEQEAEVITEASLQDQFKTRGPGKDAASQSTGRSVGKTNRKNPLEVGRPATSGEKKYVGGWIPSDKFPRKFGEDITEDQLEEGDGIYHPCTKSFKHAKFGEGTVLHGEHTLNESGEVSHYDAKFVREDGSQFIVRNIPVRNMIDPVVESHGHKPKKKMEDVNEEEQVAEGGYESEKEIWDKTPAKKVSDAMVKGGKFVKGVVDKVKDAVTSPFKKEESVEMEGKKKYDHDGDGDIDSDDYMAHRDMVIKREIAKKKGEVEEGLAELADLMALAGVKGKVELDELANEPGQGTEEVTNYSVSDVVDQGNDLHAKSKQHADKAKLGDNPMATEEVDVLEGKLWKAYQAELEGVKE